MRKIKSMADSERIKRRNNVILGIAMIALLTVSSLGYSLMSADGDKKNIVNENGLDFIKDNGMWKLTIGSGGGRDSGESDKVFGFRYLPSEVSNVDINISIGLGTYSGQPVYFVNPGEGVNEILSNIGGYVLRYQESCLLQDSTNNSNQELITDGLKNNSIGNDGSVVACKGDLPIKDCSSNLIIFEDGNVTKVYSKENCVFIVGDASLGSDAFLYGILGI